MGFTNFNVVEILKSHNSLWPYITETTNIYLCVKIPCCKGMHREFPVHMRTSGHFTEHGPGQIYYYSINRTFPIPKRKFESISRNNV